MKFSFLGENTEKYITFLVPIEKEVKRIHENWKENAKTRSCRIQSVNSIRFLASSLSNLVNNFAKGVHKIKCKSGHDKKMWNVGN